MNPLGSKVRYIFYAIRMLCTFLSQTDISHTFTLYILKIDFCYYPLIHTYVFQDISSTFFVQYVCCKPTNPIILLAK